MVARGRHISAWSLDNFEKVGEVRMAGLQQPMEFINGNDLVLTLPLTTGVTPRRSTCFAPRSSSSTRGALGAQSWRTTARLCQVVVRQYVIMYVTSTSSMMG